MVTHLEALAPAERLRWLDLLSYVDAMVYRERSPLEQRRFHETIVQSVQSDEDRREVLAMGKTMADVMMENGARGAAVKTRQQTLVRQLRKRFGEVPDSVVRAVHATTDVHQLDDWLDRFATASSLDELEIPVTR